NFAYVAEKTIKCSTEKKGSGTYPITHENDHEYRSDFSLGSELPRVAIVTYSVDFEKADGVSDRQVMMFLVGSDGQTDVHCEHYAL
ncbi:MAG: hypothetical protein K2N56_09460, partial [Oscillospiraceae bacterium]|nr:hypothetical protein [Oscillospiraceae bacterium]